MTGFKTLGLNRTHDTLTICVSQRLLTVHRSSIDVPLSVSIVLDVILALSERVPELDRPVTRTGDNLPVVCTEGD